MMSSISRISEASAMGRSILPVAVRTLVGEKGLPALLAVLAAQRMQARALVVPLRDQANHREAGVAQQAQRGRLDRPVATQEHDILRAALDLHELSFVVGIDRN